MFAKNTILRLFFVFVYVFLAIWILIKDFAWLNIPVSFLILFGAYIALAKSKLIKDKFSKTINDDSFDIFSIFVAIYLFIDVFFG